MLFIILFLHLTFLLFSSLLFSSPLFISFLFSSLLCFALLCFALCCIVIFSLLCFVLFCFVLFCTQGVFIQHCFILLHSFLLSYALWLLNYFFIISINWFYFISCSVSVTSDMVQRLIAVLKAKGGWISIHSPSLPNISLLPCF